MMVDELRQTMTSYADEVFVPVDLLDRVEQQARRVRRHRRAAVAAAVAAGVAASIAVVAIVAPLPLRGGQRGATTPGATFPGAGCRDPIQIIPIPANVLDWPCRGTDLATLPLAQQAFRADHHVADGQPMSYRLLYSGTTSSLTVRAGIGVYQLWAGKAGAPASTVSVVADGAQMRNPINPIADAVLPGDVAGIVRKLPASRPDRDVGGDSEDLLVVAAPDVTAAAYDDGLGHQTPIVLREGAAVAPRAAHRGDRADAVLLTRPGGIVRIGIYDQEKPRTVVPRLAGTTVGQARQLLAAAGLRSVEGLLPTGDVRGSSPRAGTALATGTPVALDVSSPAPPPIASPPLSSPSPRPAADSTAQPTPVLGPDGLTATHPWGLRGDPTVATRLDRPGLAPIWAGRIDAAGDTATVGVGAKADGTAVIETLVHRATGPSPRVELQALHPGQRLVCALLDGPTPALLVLGPPGSRVATAVPGVAHSAAQSGDGAALYPLADGTSPYPGTVIVVPAGGGAPQTLVCP